MAGIIRVNGVNQTIAKINKFAERKIVKLDKIMDQSLKTMASQANANAPGDIKGTVRTQRIDVLAYDIGSEVPYAAYVEFGTGDAARGYVPSLPPEWQEVARRKIINGLGRTGVQKFLYPAVEDGLPEMIKKMKENA
jgi:hypothetical protein